MDKKILKVSGLIVLAGLLISACATKAPVVVTMPGVEVSDQTIENSMVTIDVVSSSGPGWMVIHADNEGAPGPVLGYTHVQDGKNTAVKVEIDEAAATDTLFAMLHTDAGVVGTYEFPGADVPVVVNEKVMMKPFSVAGAMEEKASSNEVQVSMINFKFDPAELTIPVGTTVVWTNKDNVQHTVTSGLRGSPTELFDKAVGPGETFSYTFGEAGTFDYFCIPHTGMDAKITVE